MVPVLSLIFVPTTKNGCAGAALYFLANSRTKTEDIIKKYFSVEEVESICGID